MVVFFYLEPVQSSIAMDPTAPEQRRHDKVRGGGSDGCLGCCCCLIICVAIGAFIGAIVGFANGSGAGGGASLGILFAAIICGIGFAKGAKN